MLSRCASRTLQASTLRCAVAVRPATVQLKTVSASICQTRHHYADVIYKDTGVGTNLVAGKTPEELIAMVPPIEVHGTQAICDGGCGGVGGHPVVFIQLNKMKDTPSTCGYCGLRFVMAHHH